MTKPMLTRRVYDMRTGESLEMLPGQVMTDAIAKDHARLVKRIDERVTEAVWYAMDLQRCKNQVYHADHHNAIIN